jgi:hypothetical protein
MLSHFFRLQSQALYRPIVSFRGIKFYKHGYRDIDLLMGDEERARLSGYFDELERVNHLFKEDTEAYEQLTTREKTFY